MKKNILMIELLLFVALLFIPLLYGVINDLFSLIIFFIIGSIFSAINLFIYKNKFIIYKGGKKKSNKPLILFLLINSILFIILQRNNISLIPILLLVINLISNILIYLFINKEYKKQNSVQALIFMTIFNFVIISNLSIKLIVLNSIYSLVLFSSCLFDDLAIYRKKNYIFMIIAGILLGIGYNLSVLSLLYSLFFILIISRKQGIRSAIKLSVPSVIMFLITIIIFNVFNITISDYILIKNNPINYLIFSPLILYGIIGSIYAINNLERKLGYVCRGIIIALVVASRIINKDIILVDILSFEAIYIILLINIMENLPNIFRLKACAKKVKNSYSINGDKKVTAVIPNYNYEGYICERINSVLFQTYKISELIILDDVSKDNSVEVIEKKLEEVKKEYPDLRVQFIKNKKNSGNVFKQWAKSFEVSNCDYLWICEADDSASPYFLENVMKGFNDPKVILSYSESLTMDENDKLLMPDLREWIDIYDSGRWNKSYITTGTEEIINTLCINNTIANVSSVVFKKSKNIDYIKYLKTAEEFKLAGDWYFYVKVLEHGNISYCKKSLNYHRMHSKSVTLTTKNDLHFKEICRIQDMIMKDYKLKKEVKQLVLDRRENVRVNFALGHEELRLLDIPFEKILNKANVKDKVLLSIIIPVYNTELYLEKCLNSVLNNIPPKTEVLIINDGSPDNSDKIAKEFEKKYKDIISYYKKENGGLSSAKNYGLKKAKGRYIIYLDSDDYVEHNMYITLLKKGLETDADIVYSDIYEVYEDGTKRFISMTNDERNNKIMQIADTPMMAASWNKIVKKDLYGDLLYPEGYNNEDVAVSPILFEKAKRIEKIDSPFYNYLQRTGSIQNSGFNEKRFVIFDTAKMCFNELEKINSTNIEEIKGSIYTHQILGLLLFVISKLPKEDRIKYLKMFCKKMNEFDDYKTNKYVLEYIEKYKLFKLLKYIENEEIKKLDLYLKVKIR